MRTPSPLWGEGWGGGRNIQGKPTALPTSYNIHYSQEAKLKNILRKLIPDSLWPHLRLGWFRIRGFFLRRKNGSVECPICNGHFHRFLPHGSERICPGCGTARRQRLMTLYLRRETDLFTSSKKLLHIAADLTLHRLVHRYSNLDYASFDLHRKYTDRNGDLTDLPDADNSHDAVICFHVLEHIPDDHAAMSEMHRIINSDGWALIQVPHYPDRGATYEDFSITDPQERKKHFGQWDHVRVYGNDFQQRLEKAGFTVRFVDYLAELTEDDIARYGLAGTKGFHRSEK
ncbi:class I SAM-dependent methyltransferase [bacterium]|nr:class I SAM-dependent methyltransferase [bacterium]